MLNPLSFYTFCNFYCNLLTPLSNTQRTNLHSRNHTFPIVQVSSLAYPIPSMTMVASFMPSLAFAAAAPHVHDFNDIVTVFTDGEITAKSVSYDHVKTAMSKAEMSPYIELVKAPTCTEDGVAVISCQKDGCKADYANNTLEVKVTVTGNHLNVIDKEVSLAEAKAYLVKNGTATTTVATWAKSDDVVNACKLVAEYCTVCGNITAFDKDDDDNVVPHQPLEENTCNGKTTCKVCNKVMTCGTGKAHSYAGGKTVEVAATCTAPAYVQKVCDVCGEPDGSITTAVPGTVAKGHNFGTPVAKTEACVGDTDNLNNGYFSITGVTGTDANGYPVTKTEYYKANAVIEGEGCVNKAVLQCKDCEKYVNFAADHTIASSAVNGAMEAATGAGAFVTNDENSYTKAVAHDYEVTEKAATCHANAKTVKVCKNCGDKVETMKLNTKLQHQYKVVAVPVAGDCSNGVNYTVVCTNCEASNCGVTHTPQYTAVEADGTKYFTGFEGETALSTSNYIKVPAAVAQAAHKPGKLEKIADATCKKGELQAQRCTVCKKILANTIVEVGLPKDHTLEEVKTPETCQTTAKTETKCSVCGEVTKTVGGLPKADAKDCDYSVWKVVKESTVFEEGMKKSACAVCGQLEEGGSSIAIAKKTVAKASNTVTAGKKKLTVKSSAANATGYRVYYKKAGAKSWKSYTKKTASLSKTFSGLSKGKYYVKVKAYAKNYAGDGLVVWGATSSTKSVKVK